MMTISQKVTFVVSKALFAASVAGAAMLVGCAASPDGDVEQAPTQSAEAKLMLVDDGSLDAVESTDTLQQLKPSPVTCTGDQDNGGRICCDATHCCINIGGTINCDLPPRKLMMTLY